MADALSRRVWFSPHSKTRSKRYNSSSPMLTSLPPRPHRQRHLSRRPYPLPLVPAALEQLRGARFFIKLDLHSAYNLIRIKEGDKWKTVFHTTQEHYEYLVMPFGLTNALPVFQALINGVFQDVLNKYVIAYINDILVYSASFEEHVCHVREVLSCLLKNCLYVKPEKCEFHRHTVTFLGYVISPRGVEMDQSKVQAVTGWLEGVRHPFLVLTNHRNLEYLKATKRLNSRQARWALFFTRFDFSVTYRPRSKNGQADALSQQFEVVPPPPHPDSILPQFAILGPIRWNLVEEIQQAHTEESPHQPSVLRAKCIFPAGTASKLYNGCMSPSVPGTRVFTRRPSSCIAGSGGPL
ncbi:hypothetical protein QTP86_015420 [Hemibagrus guttatus]|nr:hypothetical protein QTP86_015420 [Hemibagrus guttatus]